jgi:UDP-N-acetylglucosamine/UDP-N-acetylgalactosamine 4-epimerase
VTTAYDELRERLKSRPRFWVVTGAAGFIGSHIVEALLRLNQRVTGLDNLSTGRRANLALARSAVSEAQWRGFRLIEGDIRSPETCRRACRAADYVLHQAALGSAPRSIEHPVGVHDANLTGFLNVLVAARDAGVARFVYAGSNAAYGDRAEAPQDEQLAARPLSPYAATKYMNELYAEVFAHCYAFDSIGLRYFNIYGPRQDADGPYAAVIPRWISCMIRREPVFIDGDGAAARDYCHVDDIVQANLLAATTEDPAALNQVYNAALGTRTTLMELFGAISRLLAPRFPHVRGLRPVHRAVRVGDTRVSQASTARAEQRLGYRPRWTLEEGLARTVDWYAAAQPASPAQERPVPGSRPAFGGSVGSYA